MIHISYPKFHVGPKDGSLIKIFMGLNSEMSPSVPNVTVGRERVKVLRRFPFLRSKSERANFATGKTLLCALCFGQNSVGQERPDK